MQQEYKKVVNFFYIEDFYVDFLVFGRLCLTYDDVTYSVDMSLG